MDTDKVSLVYKYFMRQCMETGKLYRLPDGIDGDGKVYIQKPQVWVDDEYEFGFRNATQTELWLPPPSSPTLPTPPTPPITLEYPPSPFDSQEWNGRMKRWGWLNEAA